MSFFPNQYNREGKMKIMASRHMRIPVPMTKPNCPNAFEPVPASTKNATAVVAAASTMPIPAFT